MTKISKFNIELAIDLYIELGSVTEVAKRINFTKSYVYKKLKENNIKVIRKDTKKVSDKILIESYNKLNNVWKVGEEVGLSGQSVHERLSKLNLITKDHCNSKNKFKDFDILKEKYNQYVSEGRLQELADELGRTKYFICRKAKEIGLTNNSRIQIMTDKRIEAYKNQWKEKEHPRGMLGKTHSDKFKKDMSKRSKERWRSYSIKERYEIIKKMTLNNDRKNIKRTKCSWNGGWREINNKKYFFRSEWEYIYALYLQYQLEHNKISKWENEPKRFVFDNGESVSTYLPDFRITNLNNSIEYHEVKGWFDQRSQNKLFNMSFFYPNEKIIIINVNWFRKNKLKLKKYGYNGNTKF